LPRYFWGAVKNSVPVVASSALMLPLGLPPVDEYLTVFVVSSPVTVQPSADATKSSKALTPIAGEPPPPLPP
jgi:hypothetical protein